MRRRYLWLLLALVPVALGTAALSLILTDDPQREAAPPTPIVQQSAPEAPNAAAVTPAETGPEVPASLPATQPANDEAGAPAPEPLRPARPAHTDSADMIDSPRLADSRPRDSLGEPTPRLHGRQAFRDAFRVASISAPGGGGGASGSQGHAKPSTDNANSPADVSGGDSSPDETVHNEDEGEGEPTGDEGGSMPVIPDINDPAADDQQADSHPGQGDQGSDVTHNEGESTPVIPDINNPPADDQQADSHPGDQGPDATHDEGSTPVIPDTDDQHADDYQGQDTQGSDAAGHDGDSLPPSTPATADVFPADPILDESEQKPVQVPEPASMGLLLVGLLGCAAGRRRQS